MQGKYMYIEGVLGTTYSSEFSMIRQAYGPVVAGFERFNCIKIIGRENAYK